MNSRTTVIMVIGALALTAMVCLGFIGALALTDRNVPDAFHSVLGTAVGAIAGILAKTNTIDADPPPLTPTLPPLRANVHIETEEQE